MSCDCPNAACKEKYKKLMDEIGHCDDSDYWYYHCTIDGCHDISLGKTSFCCEDCGAWICQGCSDTKMKDYDGDGTTFYCLDCVSFLEDVRNGRMKDIWS